MLMHQPEPAQILPEVHKILREPFPPEQIGKLPRITCRDCHRAQGRVCDRHQKGQCSICRNWITSAHMHLDYIGHAAVTDRLLRADPNWSWEPAYRDVDPHVLASAVASGEPEIVAMVLESAPPKMDGPTGIWIKLTIGGVTRLGYGTDDDPGMDHDKKLISDAIRNAAMRFGVGLDLWSKEDLGAAEQSPGTPALVPPDSTVVAGSAPRNWVEEARAATTLDELLKIGQACNESGDFVGTTKASLLRRRRELEGSRS